MTAFTTRCSEWVYGCCHFCGIWEFECYDLPGNSLSIWFSSILDLGNRDGKSTRVPASMTRLFPGAWVSWNRLKIYRRRFYAYG